MKYPAHMIHTASRILGRAACLVSIGLLGSCLSHHGVVVADVDPLDWSPDDTVSVAYPNRDSTGLYDLSLLVRYNDDLPAGPLSLSVETFTPDSLAFRETVLLYIPARNPRELSGRNPIFFEHEAPYRLQVRFGHGGLYRFRFAPADRRHDPLGGITAVGLRITPASTDLQNDK